MTRAVRMWSIERSLNALRHPVAYPVSARSCSWCGEQEPIQQYGLFRWLLAGGVRVCSWECRNEYLDALRAREGTLT